MKGSTARELECTCPLRDLMRAVVPVPGIDYKKILIVTMGPGDRIDEHEHDEHTVLYYPADSAELRIKPRAGTIIYLPPNTLHSVPKVSKQRVSVAMLVE